MKRNIATISSILLISVLSFAGTYSGGDGLPGTPYQISTTTDWQELIDTPGDWSAAFVLINNLDLASISPVTAIGGCSGVFDGNDFVISNVTIDMPADQTVGLFESNYGTIKNLNLDNVDINGGYNVGGLCGENHGTILNCTVSGQVDGFVGVGILAGANIVSGTISDCSASGEVNSSHNPSTIGGLSGFNGGLIENSCAIVNVHGAGDEVGGLVGKNNGTIHYCYASGQITGTGLEIGGFAGINSSSGTIENCYATGDFSAEPENVYGQVGGLVGYNVGAIHYCYATGTSSELYGIFDYGGLIGENATLHTMLVANFWDTETSGTTTGILNDLGGGVGEESIGNSVGIESDPEGVTGKTTAEMKTKSTFVDAGWDFAGVWVMPIFEYPKLQPRLAGDVDMDDAVNLDDFAILAEHWLESI